MQCYKIFGIAALLFTAASAQAADISNINVNYECTFADGACTLEGHIGSDDAVVSERPSATFNLECDKDKHGSISIQDEDARVDKRGDDLAITGREDDKRATVKIEDFFDRDHTFEASLKIKGHAALSGECSFSEPSGN